MVNLDKDLRSIQEVRDLVSRAKEAQKSFSKLDQASINKVVDVLAEAAFENAEKLAKMANEETGFGKWQDKKAKNVLASEKLNAYMKDMKTVGILNEDAEKKVVEIGVPMGVIAGLIPSTNPTSTVIYKTLISLKAGNSIVLAHIHPH